MADIREGTALDNTCRHVTGHPMFSLPRGPAVLGFDLNNGVVSRHMARGNYDLGWFDAMVARGVEQCFPTSDYFVRPGRLLRMAVKAISRSPVCFGIGLGFFRVKESTGEVLDSFPVHYFLDPTTLVLDPYYTHWAIKRGNGGVHGGCFDGETGHCGDINVTSDAPGEILLEGGISGGHVVGTPPTDTYTDGGCTFTALLTGCCPGVYEFVPPTIINVTYNICAYGAGDVATSAPGP